MRKPFNSVCEDLFTFLLSKAIFLFSSRASRGVLSLLPFATSSPNDSSTRENNNGDGCATGEGAKGGEEAPTLSTIESPVNSKIDFDDEEEEEEDLEDEDDPQPSARVTYHNRRHGRVPLRRRAVQDPPRPDADDDATVSSGLLACLRWGAALLCLFLSAVFLLGAAVAIAEEVAGCGGGGGDVIACAGRWIEEARDRIVAGWAAAAAVATGEDF